MTTHSFELPALPKHNHAFADPEGDAPDLPVWTADSMRAYATAAALAERERCIRIIEAHQVSVGNSAAGEMAAEWTMDALREIRDAIRGPQRGN